MVELLIWVLMAYGMSTILVYGSIFEKHRQFIIGFSDFFGSLISCMLCTSFWIGIFLSFSLGGLVNHYFNTGIFTFFFDGIFTAGAVWGINSFVEFFEESRFNLTKDDR